jgi:hypothetical protein
MTMMKAKSLQLQAPLRNGQSGRIRHQFTGQRRVEHIGRTT